MIKLFNGYVISNIVISTIMGHSGGGDMFPLSLFPGYRSLVRKVKETQTISISESATYSKRKGSHNKLMPWQTIKKIRIRTQNGCETGLVNSFGLTNEGIIECARKIRLAMTNGFEVIPSFFPELSKGPKFAISEGRDALDIYDSMLGNSFRVIEYNPSCPNSGEDICAHTDSMVEVVRMTKREFPQIAVIVKLSYAHDFSFVRRLEEAGTDVFHSMNTFRFYDFFPRSMKSPIPAKFGYGGVSGRITFEKAFRHNQDLIHQVKTPIIFGCGISSLEHIRQYQNLAATERRDCSLSICTIVREDPRFARDILEKFN